MITARQYGAGTLKHHWKTEIERTALKSAAKMPVRGCPSQVTRRDAVGEGRLACVCVLPGADRLPTGSCLRTEGGVLPDYHVTPCR